MRTQAVLLIQDLTIRYGSSTAVDGLSLEVRPGEIYGLLGPNGSGKSSTLSAISGAFASFPGEIRILGRREADDPKAYRRAFGLVPQELAIYEELTADNNLSFFGALYGLAGRDLRRRIASVLDFVQLSEQSGRSAQTYSGGMKRRLNLACALLHQPQLLLLDEPTVGLDIQSRDAIFESLRQLRKQGTAIVFTTHHMEEAELLCDRLAIMDRGRLIAEGTLDELRDELAFASQPTGYHLPEKKSPPDRLEQIFLELTGRELRDR